jgi:AcrR family transcriptional regulator
VTNVPPDPTDDDKPGQRVPLTRARVLAAALRLVDDEGLDALTRRRLGQELGRDAMALYRHAPDRAALLDGIVELVLDELDIPDGGQDWQMQLSRTAHDFRRIGLAHPHVVSLIVTRPLATPLGLRPLGTLRPLERLLRLLTDAGFPPNLALRVYRLYIGFLYGHMLTELQELVADPEETTDMLRLGLHRLPPREFPLIRGLASVLAHYDGEAELDQGLAVLFTGLRTELAIAQVEDPTLGRPPATTV